MAKRYRRTEYVPKQASAAAGDYAAGRIVYIYICTFFAARLQVRFWAGNLFPAPDVWPKAENAAGRYGRWLAAVIG